MVTVNTIVNYWAPWAEAVGVPYNALVRWALNPRKLYHCIFCGRHGSADVFNAYDENMVCPKCRAYKGIEPCIPKHCFWMDGSLGG